MCRRARRQLLGSLPVIRSSVATPYGRPVSVCLCLSDVARRPQLFGCLSALVDTDPAIEVRRAAVLLVSQLIDGLGPDALKVG